MTGRGVAVMAALGADLQPAGWRLTDAPGVDQRRARSLLAQDLDGFEEQSQGYAGTVKVQVAGPWTLAATVERPRGDKVLADFGARRDLAQALAEGLRDHVADLRRRVPNAAGIVVQVDEPALAAVLVRGDPDGVRVRPAPRRPPSRGVAGAGVGAGCGRRGRRRAVGPHLRGRDAAGPAARRGRARAVGRPGPAVRARPRRARGRARGGGDRRARRRTVDRSRARRRPTRRSPSRSCGGWTCSARTPTRWATGWCSPRLRAGRRVAARGRSSPSPC